MRKALTRLDIRLFDRVARGHTPLLDRTLPPLTRAGNNSLIWLVTAGVLAFAGGRRAQRGAIRGVGSIGLTSLFVNQVVKRLVRRPRPDLRHVPAGRRLKAQPLTTSFPSGHAASAAAFAVAVSSEMPAAAVPLGTVAAAVAGSRTYVGAHYPFDVLVGAATGAAIATATRLVWPVLPSDIEDQPPTRRPIELEPRPEGEGVTLIVNNEAGSALSDDPRDQIRERLPKARIIELDDPSSLPDVVRDAARDSEVIGIVGGDGSTVTAATAAVEHDVPLLLIPAGTLNHLGRDLRVESASDAIDALERGEAVAIDLGEIDGKPFVNTASFGSYTEMLERREELQKRIGRWPAHVVAVAAAIFRTKPLELRIDGERRVTWMVYVGNSRHEPAGFAPSWRPALDDGMLDVRILHGERPFARLRLLASILTGRLTRSAVYEQKVVPELQVESGNGGMPLSRDGDGFDGSGSFTIRKWPSELVVYAPMGSDR